MSGEGLLKILSDAMMEQREAIAVVAQGLRDLRDEVHGLRHELRTTQLERASGGPHE